MLEPVRPEAVLLDRVLCLPTFSHFLIVNKSSLTLSLALSLDLALALALSRAVSRSLALATIILLLLLLMSATLYRLPLLYLLLPVSAKRVGEQ